MFMYIDLYSKAKRWIVVTSSAGNRFVFRRPRPWLWMQTGKLKSFVFRTDRIERVCWVRINDQFKHNGKWLVKSGCDFRDFSVVEINGVTNEVTKIERYTVESCVPENPIVSEKFFNLIYRLFNEIHSRFLGEKYCWKLYRRFGWGAGCGFGPNQFQPWWQIL